MRAGTVEEGAVGLLLWFENLDILGARGHAAGAQEPPQDPPAPAEKEIRETSDAADEDAYMDEELEDEQPLQRARSESAGAVLERSSTRSPRHTEDEDSSVASTNTTPRRVIWKEKLVIDRSLWSRPHNPPSTPPAKSPRPIIKAASWNAEQFKSDAVKQREALLERELDEAISCADRPPPPPARKESWKSWLSNPAKSVKRLMNPRPSGEARVAQRLVQSQSVE